MALPSTLGNLRKLEEREASAKAMVLRARSQRMLNLGTGVEYERLYH